MGALLVAGRRNKIARTASQLNARSGYRDLPALVLMMDDRIEVVWEEAARALPAGSAIIVRHRNSAAREALAQRLLSLCRARRVKVLVADDIALGVRLRADGVHLPHHQAHQARKARCLNSRLLITSSAHNEAEFAHAVRAGVDAVFVSPVFATESHTGANALGASGVAQIIGRRLVAAYALGGIDAGNCGQLARVPLCGLALIRGWL